MPTLLYFAIPVIIVSVVAMAIFGYMDELRERRAARRRAAARRRLSKLTADGLLACTRRADADAVIAAELLVERGADIGLLEKIAAGSASCEASQTAREALCRLRGHQMQGCHCTCCHQTIHQGYTVTRMVECSFCDGRGAVDVGGGYMDRIYDDCSECHGTGMREVSCCSACGEQVT